MFQHQSVGLAAAAAGMTSSCPWTYQLECDETRSPSVVITARCLGQTDRCEQVLATMAVKRWNSVTEHVEEVYESFPVACRPVDQYNPTDYTVE